MKKHSTSIAEASGGTGRAGFKDYYQLTKPGIIYGNVLTTAASFLFASRGHIHFGLFLAIMLGSSLTIASGCVFNNYLDRGIDIEMSRTKKRALVTGLISPRSALIYATLLGLAGFSTLIAFTNGVTALVGLTGFIFYVIVYGYFKRRSVHGTVVGSVSGAVPVVAGYTAVAGHLGVGALLLFMIMATWQMPHFYGIAMYRAKEYGAAHIPVLPLVKGMRSAQRYTLVYIGLYLVACSLLTIFGYAGYSFLIVMLGLGATWLYRSLKLLNNGDYPLWGRKTFLFSLIVLLGFSVMLSVGSILP